MHVVWLIVELLCACVLLRFCRVALVQFGYSFYVETVWAVPVFGSDTSTERVLCTSAP